MLDVLITIDKATSSTPLQSTRMQRYEILNVDVDSCNIS